MDLYCDDWVYAVSKYLKKDSQDIGFRVMCRRTSLIKAEADNLSSEACAILMSAQFDGGRWKSCSGTADVVQELIGLKAAVEYRDGLSITGRGIVFRYHLARGKYIKGDNLL